VVFPTHRLLTGLKDSPEKQEALGEAMRRDFEVEQIAPDQLEPSNGDGRVRFGYMDSHFKQPYRLTLKDQAIADRALAGKPEPYRHLDTAVLEALALRGALGMSEEDIAEKHGLAFFMAPTPIDQVREVAEAGESMPPKSTYFYPKIPTGLVFNVLE
jgi:uncharacterized protein (DUF1015 family)